MAKKTQKLPKFEEWKAQWEVDAEGKDIPEDEQQFDAARAKKLIYDLLSDKHRAQDQVFELTESKEKLEQQVAEATDPKKLEDLQAEVTKARQERDEAKSGGNIQALRYEIALEKGLTKAQARRLVGESREELEEDAEEMVKEFGFKAKNKDDQTQDDDKDDDDTVEPRRGPRNRFSNPGDPDPNAGKGGKEPTPEDVYKGYRALV